MRALSVHARSPNFTCTNTLCAHFSAQCPRVYTHVQLLLSITWYARACVRGQFNRSRMPTLALLMCACSTSKHTQVSAHYACDFVIVCSINPPSSPVDSCNRGEITKSGEFVNHVVSNKSVGKISSTVHVHVFVSQIKSAATHFISYKVRASRQFIQVQNLKVITTKISYFRQTTQVNSNSA